MFKVSLAVVLAGLAAGAVQAEEVVRIGHVAATSGAIAHLGKDNENGARMAVEEVNAKGLIIGGTRYRLVLQAIPSRARWSRKNWSTPKSMA
jgi:branched-chain amino acid transport system substrate-binding protein